MSETINTTLDLKEALADSWVQRHTLYQFSRMNLATESEFKLHHLIRRINGDRGCDAVNDHIVRRLISGKQDLDHCNSIELARVIQYVLRYTMTPKITWGDKGIWQTVTLHPNIVQTQYQVNNKWMSWTTYIGLDTDQIDAAVQLQSDLLWSDNRCVLAGIRQGQTRTGCDLEIKCWGLSKFFLKLLLDQLQTND